MFVAPHRLKIQKDHGEELEGLFRSRGGVEQQPGFVKFELWKLDRDAEHEEYLVVGHWESKEAHDEWTRSEAFRQAHAGPHPGFLMGRGEFHSYDVRLSSTPAGVKA